MEFKKEYKHYIDFINAIYVNIHTEFTENKNFLHSIIDDLIKDYAKLQDSGLSEKTIRHINFSGIILDELKCHMEELSNKIAGKDGSIVIRGKNGAQ